GPADAHLVCIRIRHRLAPVARAHAERARQRPRRRARRALRPVGEADHAAAHARLRSGSGLRSAAEEEIAVFARRWDAWLAKLESAAAGDAELHAFRKGADCRFRLVAGERVAVFSVSEDEIRIKNENGATPFSLEAPVEVWQKFFAAMPPAFYHAVYAMKMRVPEFKVTGDELALAQSIHLVRRLLEIGREGMHGTAKRRKAKKKKRERIKGSYVWVELEGRPNRLYCEQAGKGLDLLCLHTAGSDSRQFCHLMNDRELAREWRMTAFDLPWHGKSLPPEGGFPGEW